ncbi:peptidase inhibitor family I36 protein [Hamadaea sp. NPDC051192]|uniref:peptidase inhibitor family I36 protein n=1 Tax=Hamadaea sp. NPDC051192 TaxID=3154940 RepID=UPI0034498CB1
MRSLIAAVAAAVLCGSLLPTPAAAEPGPNAQQSRELLSKRAGSPAELQRQVELQLKLYPGGEQTAANEVAYDNGKFVITFAQPADAPDASGVGILGAPDCPSGWFCFYDYANYGYPRGKLSDCGAQDLSQYGWNDRAESQHNNTYTGVSFFNHIGAFHGYFSISSSDQELAFASSLTAANFDYPNMIDHVSRFCG